MFLSALLSVALGQTAQQPFAQKTVVSEISRLAITPKLDGVIDPEEWDPLASSGGADSYFQWEPGKVHFAAHLPAGQDFLVSFDAAGDGWLQGKDNLEIRVHMKEGQPELTERILDATGTAGPAWTDASSWQASTQVAAKTDDKGWTVEVSVQDPGSRLLPEEPGKTVGLRVDAVPPEFVAAEPFIPRVVTLVNLVFDRGNNVPAGLKWNPQFRGRTVIPGEQIRIRFDFTGNEDLGLKRIETRTEGLGRDFTSSQGIPFPPFNAKNRAVVDYETKVAEGSPMGYRVLQGTITDSKGGTCTIQTCYEISPLVTFDWNEPKKLATSSEPQNFKFSAYVRSNTKRRVDGVFRVIPPEGWKVESGNEKGFIIYNPRGSKRQVFSLIIPGGFKGTAPLKLQADFAGQHAEQTVWIVVQ